jgi:transcriptional regulator with XRE-family HTH domain
MPLTELANTVQRNQFSLHLKTMTRLGMEIAFHSGDPEPRNLMPPTSDDHDLGRRIAVWRVQRGRSQVELSRRAGIHATYLSRIETGKVHPTVRTVMRIASALQVSVNDLAGPSPATEKKKPCPATSSGRCLLDLIDTGSNLEGDSDEESYSPRQIRLLRRFMEILRQSSPSVLSAHEVILGGHVEDRS